MKFGKRISLLASVAMVAGLVPALSAQAQGSSCTLAASDCQLLTDASTNVAKESSFVQTFTFKIDIQGDSPVSATVTGTGPFSEDPSANMTDQNAVVKGIQAQLDITGSATTPGSPAQSGKVSVIVKDGVLYVQDPTTSKWSGIDLIKAIAAGQAQMSASGSSSGASSAAAQAAIAQFTSDPAIVSGLAALPNIKGFITQTRLTNDATLEGQKMAQIQYTITPSALFTSPDVLPLIKAVLKDAAAASPSSGASASQLSNMNDQQLQGMLMMGGGVLGSTNIQVTRWVGADDKMYHALDFLINLNIDPTTLGGTGKPVTGTIDLNVQLTKVGQPVSVTAPAGATMVDMSQMMGGAMGATGGAVVATPAATP